VAWCPQRLRAKDRCVYCTIVTCPSETFVMEGLDFRLWLQVPQSRLAQCETPVTLPQEFPVCPVGGRGKSNFNSEKHMNEASSTYFTQVQNHLNEMGQSSSLTADERDIVDDYATQDFGAKQCAEQIAGERT